MILDRVTITGADDKTDRAELYAMWLLYPFVEWGVLFSKSKEGSPRYPTQTKISEVASFDMPLSAHFCGWYSRSIMEEQNLRIIDNLPPNFKRIQLNYNFQKENNWRLKPIIDYAAHHPERSIIFQANQSNGAAIQLIRATMNSDNIHFLYDSSGGRGVELSNILPPFETYTGYSGGLHPGNVEAVVQKILNHKLKRNVWIDLESGVRTENNFDPGKANEVLQLCEQYIQRS
jgi:phosphoribosylanthranilate isomerase